MTEMTKNTYKKKKSKKKKKKKKRKKSNNKKSKKKKKKKKASFSTNLRRLVFLKRGTRVLDFRRADFIISSSVGMSPWRAK